MPTIAVVGKSGTGKSTSFCPIPELGIEGINPKESFVISVCQTKDLPFRGWKKYYKDVTTNENGNFLSTSDPTLIVRAINHVNQQRPEIKNIVIDDGQYIMAFEFMNRAKESGYNKFTDIGVNINRVITAASNVRKDLNIFFLWHPENDKEAGYKMKTVGKMVDDYLTLEGLFSVVLYSKVERDISTNKSRYLFVTNNDGEYPAKSPVGMFDELYIPNDLGYVIKRIIKYNEGE